MKILHVIPSYEPAWAFGGTVSATSNLCRCLARKGVDITVYTTDADGKGGHLDVPLNEEVDLGGVKALYFKCDFLVKKAFYSKQLYRKLSNNIQRFDIVHVSSIWQWHQVAVRKVCGKYDIPYIVTPHNSLSSRSMNLSKNTKKKIYWSIWSKNTIKKAKALHFLCEGERKISIHNILSIPSFLVPNAVDCNNYRRSFDNRLRQELGINQDKIVLLSVGRIHPTKRIELVLESFIKLDQPDKFILLLIGPIMDENYHKFLQTLIRSYNLENKIRWIGFVDNKELVKFYSIADSMILLSEFEGISMSSIEALATGIPLLISKGIANWEEIIKDGSGILIDHPYSIAEKLNQLSSGKINLKIISQNARQSAEKRYDINKVTSLMIKAYEDVLTGRRSPELQWQ